MIGFSTSSATMVPGAPGWWEWMAGRCPRCRTFLCGFKDPRNVAPWGTNVNRRRELTFPLSHCWLCRVQQGYFIHVSFDA